ncbi:4-carboxymuconolactone decarboxylase [Streptomyces peucetius subsp. caesius ATCC 27952]|nr:4-carboxymuconolactone decarboxylase [Streptomyces peucetius subsp. caesius ATCC 27952]
MPLRVVLAVPVQPGPGRTPQPGRRLFLVNERYLRGAARQAELGGPGETRRQVYDELADIAPDLSRLAVEFAYGDIHARPGLDPGRRELVILGVLIALGDAGPQIRAHLNSALAVGITPAELVEAVIQAVPYAGFPRVLAAMSIARQVFDQHGLLPIDPIDPIGQGVRA